MKKSMAIRRMTYGKAWGETHEQCKVYFFVAKDGCYLKGLDKGPEQDPDGIALSQQLHQARSPEQPEEANVDEVFLKGGKYDILCKTGCFSHKGRLKNKGKLSTFGGQGGSLEVDKQCVGGGGGRLPQVDNKNP